MKEYSTKFLCERVLIHGDVTLTYCETTQDVGYGNLWKDSLYNIWNSDADLLVPWLDEILDRMEEINL